MEKKEINGFWLIYSHVMLLALGDKTGVNFYLFILDWLFMWIG